PPSPVDVAIRFNDAINRRDVDELARLMTDDHAFTDTAGAGVTGKADCLAAWRGFFEQFPDYRNTFTRTLARGDVAIAVGYASCATEALDGPAIWTAETRGSQVSHWRVHHDSLAVRASLQI